MTNPISTVKKAAEKISKIHPYGATPKSMEPIRSLAHKILTALQEYERSLVPKPLYTEDGLKGVHFEPQPPKQGE